MNELRSSFKNPNVTIVCADSVAESVKYADVIVTATYTETPFLFRSMIKNNVHINGTKVARFFLFNLQCKIYQFLAVGAGESGHHTEIGEDIYTDSETKIYVDTIAGARVELNTLKAPIVCEVGDIINGHKPPPTEGITIFHSMGINKQFLKLAEKIINGFYFQ